MTFGRLFILGFLTSFWCYGQNEGRELAFSLPTYTLESVDSLESMTCQEYLELRYDILYFNHIQKVRAWNMVDSLTNLESPCYEFYIDSQCESHLDEITSSPLGCEFFASSTDNLCVNSTINIYRKRQFKTEAIGTTSTVYCEEDLIRN